MCFVCVSASRQSGDHPNHIENSTYDNGLTQTTYQVSISGASANVQALTDGTSWGTEVGQAVTVTYSFDISGADSEIVYSNNAQAFTSAQQQATLGVFNKLSAIANVTFVEAASSASAQLHFYFGDLTLSGTAGVAGFFTSGHFGQQNLLTGATVGMDDNSSNFTTEGTYDYATLVHEIGHAVGLKHPGDYFNGAEPGPYLPSNLDNTAFTVMSYNDDDNNVSTNPTNFLSLDIEALQYLYGAADGSATDTIGSSGNDLQNLDSAQAFAAGHGNDTVNGSAGNDTIYGGIGQVDADDGADILVGGGGSDSMFGNSGNDTMYGGDTSGSSGDSGDVMWGGKGVDEMYGNAGDDQIGGGGNVYAPNDDGDTLYGGTGNDSFTGNGGNDTIYGDNAAGTGSGNDSIHGGAANDSIVAGGGNDTINGGIGNDTMTGNDGADLFIFSDGSGVDVITDFVSGTDGLQITSGINGSSLTSSADVLSASSVSGADLVIDLGSGNSITLQNVGAITTVDILIV